MHVLSAGNSGTFDHNYGAGAGWANISGGIKAGKNVICAGNVDQNDELFFTSSRGPAADGRIKPDLCAMGQNHLSTDENNTYQVGSGTSASTPAIAGMFAQLFQAYKELNDGIEPESGLIKGILLNTAEDLGNPGPDYLYGWGRINGLKSVRLLEDERYLSDIIEQGTSNSHTITVPDNVNEVRIMTYWMDVEGNPASSLALVNDINMQVITPIGTMHNPLVLDPTPNPAKLNADAVEGIDNLNNVEQVVIKNPVPGDYEVNLEGFSIPEGPQNYYVIYDFIYNEVELTYPFGGESFVPGFQEQIRWDASFSTEPFTLEYSIDGGATYTVISNSISSTARHHFWPVPNVLSDRVKMRLSRGEMSNEIEVNMTIVDVPDDLSIETVCPDEIELVWDAVEGVSLYEISMLGDKYMDSIGVSTTNSFTVVGQNPNIDQWFSVRAVLENGKGRRAIAVNKPPGTSNCILNFDVDMAEIISPIEGLVSSCRDIENTEITLNLSNLGINNTSSFELNYQINEGAIISETIAESLMPDESLEYTFSTTVDVTGEDNIELVLWIDYPEDQNVYNDTLRTSIQIFNAPLISSLPYGESFETFSKCSEINFCETIECEMEEGWNNFANLRGDDIDWRTDSNGTNTGNTGPEFDFDSGNFIGQYVYLEASPGCEFKQAKLLSPCIDLSNALCGEFEFAYHMFGANMGELHVDIFTEQGIQQDIITPIKGNKGNQWNVSTIDLSPYLGEVINIQMRGIIGNGVLSDIAIDGLNFNVYDAPPIADFEFENGGVGNTSFFTDISTGFVKSYEWDFGDGNFSTEANPEHVYETEGQYEVTLVISGDCGDDTISQIVDVTLTNIEEEFLTSKIKIFPNPSNVNISIQFPDELLNENVQLKVINSLGQSALIIEKQNIHDSVELDVSKLKAGIYFIHMSSETFDYMKKVIIL